MRDDHVEQIGHDRTRLSIKSPNQPGARSRAAPIRAGAGRPCDRVLGASVVEAVFGNQTNRPADAPVQGRPAGSSTDTTRIGPPARGQAVATDLERFTVSADSSEVGAAASRAGTFALVDPRVGEGRSGSALEILTRQFWGVASSPKRIAAGIDNGLLRDEALLLAGAIGHLLDWLLNQLQSALGRKERLRRRFHPVQRRRFGAISGCSTVRAY
jgi:hypothetical protein